MLQPSIINDLLILLLYDIHSGERFLGHGWIHHLYGFPTSPQVIIPCICFVYKNPDPFLVVMDHLKGVSCV